MAPGESAAYRIASPTGLWNIRMPTASPAEIRISWPITSAAYSTSPRNS
jgi:hypothetical protein